MAAPADVTVAATAERIAALPCFTEPVEVSSTGDRAADLSLGEGRTNQNFIVESPSRRYFVRVGKDLPPWGVERTRERAAQRAAATASLAPEVVFSSGDIMVTGFVQGRALTEADVKAAAAPPTGSPLLRTLTGAIRALHKVPAPPEVLSDSTVGWPGPHLPRWLAYAAEREYTRLPLVAEAERLVPELEACCSAGLEGVSQPAFCHFDLLPDNFVLSGEPETPTVTLVDFEYAAGGQPLMDLAVLSMGCALSSEQEAVLVASYLQLPELSQEQAQAFRALKCLAALRETMWGVVAEVSRSSALSDEEAVAYADSNHKKFVEAREAFEAGKPRKRAREEEQ